MNETCDFVVVGSGGGAFCAALVLRAAGKSVLVLEKTPLLGGTTATSGGVLWIPNNRYMKAAGIADSADAANAYLDAVVGDRADQPGATRERRRTYVDQAPRMIDFLAEQGVRLRRMPSWPDYYDVAGASVPGRAVVSELFDIRQLGDWASKVRPGFLPLPANLDEAMQLPLIKRSSAAKKVLLRILGRAVADKFKGRKRITAGQALQAQMIHAAIEAGVQIRTQAHVKQLIVEDGRVTGVQVDGDGVSLRVTARLGVLLNAGGFARNQAMLDRYIPGTRAEWSSVIDADTGDMIEEGRRLGAAIAQMNTRIGMQVALPPGHEKMAVKPGLQNDICKPHAIVVDQAGQRFANEASSHAEFTHRMIAHGKQASPSWMICDSQFLATYMLAGTMPGRKKPAAWTSSQFLRQAATIEALALDCGIDPARLRATIERFNGFVRAGRDADFQRGDAPYDRWTGDALRPAPSNTLGTIDQAPFYAVAMVPGDVSTFGGLVTDPHARVLRTDGSVIPGLYATGTSAASVMGAVEPGPGGSIGPSFTWGYVAAKHALSRAVTTSSEPATAAA